MSYFPFFFFPLITPTGERRRCRSSTPPGSRLTLPAAFPPLLTLCLPLSPVAGVDIEAARKEEERIMLRDARQWLNSGQIQDVRHTKSGGTSLHVAAAKGYLEVLK